MYVYNNNTHYFDFPRHGSRGRPFSFSAFAASSIPYDTPQCSAVLAFLHCSSVGACFPIRRMILSLSAGYISMDPLNFNLGSLRYGESLLLPPARFRVPFIESMCLNDKKWVRREKAFDIDIRTFRPRKRSRVFRKQSCNLQLDETFHLLPFSSQMS